MEIFARFPYVIRIFQKKGDSYFVIRDSGRRVEQKDGTTVLRLKRMKKDLPFPEFQFLYVDEKGVNVIDYMSTAENEFHPIELDEKTKIRKPIEKDVLLWQVQNQLRMMKKYAKEEDRLSKLMPVIMMGMFVMAFAVTAIFTYDGLVKITAQASGIANTMDQSMARIEGIIAEKTFEIGQSTPDPTPPPF